MRNLRLHSQKWYKYADTENVDIVIPPFDNIEEVFVSHNLKISKINTIDQKVTLLFDISEIIPLQDIFIVNFAYFSIERLLVCAISSGDVIRFDIELLQVLDADNVFGKKIKAMEVSPDNELLIFVTEDGTVHLTDCRLEVINTASIKEDSFGEGEFITVGWGKKETQFHGSEGKEAAKKKIIIDENNDTSKADKTIITWRGDGSLFAVGFLMNSVYTFKVFDREVVLKFTSEKQPGLECNFSWKPSGNLIATTQHFPNKYVVAFFEKNGLKHGEFNLPFKKGDTVVNKLCWSSDSEVLCVWCTNNSTMEMYLLMYTVNNYHWYLKQSLPFRDIKVTSIAWDESNNIANGKLLNIFLNNGTYLRYNWIWAIDNSRGKTVKDNASVGVIDGNKLLLTSFRKAVIPPPMSSVTLQCENNINQIVFGPTLQDDDLDVDIDSNSFIILKDDGTIDLYKTCDNIFGTVSLYEQCIQNCDYKIPCVIKQLLWIAKKNLIAITSNGQKSNVIMIQLSMKDRLTIDNITCVHVDDEIIGISHIPHKREAVLQTCSGKLSVLTSNNVIKEFDHAFPDACFKFEVVTDDTDVFVFGLTNRHRFYINGKEVANNVNSFFVHSNFVLLTTLQHQLLCCPLSKAIIHNLSNLGATENMNDPGVWSRKLERGSRLVCVVPCDTRTILQLPRGNIEAIQPRALSLHLIGDFLDNCKYYNAFDLMRKQRINLNLICDHDLDRFIQNVDTFISQIDNPSWMSLFISELDNQDVTKTMYFSSYTSKSIKMSTNFVNKVESLCNLMRKVLHNNNIQNKNLLPILTTYVKTNSIGDLEKALLLIKDLNVENQSQEKRSLVSGDEALKYLLYLVNVDKLYDTSLGLYDFDLVMFVASKSQKDPKEYVPYLNELKQMDENYKRFSIDNSLKRYESAMKNLICCGLDRETELLSYIKKYNLYKAALQNIPKNDPRYGRCAEEFGNYLLLGKKYAEAGVLFMRCNNLSKALNAFIDAGDWRSAMFIMEDLNMSATEIIVIQQKLISKLRNSKSYLDILELYQYNNQVSTEEMVSCALEGKLFRTSLSICKQHKRLDLIETHINNVVLEQYLSLMSIITQNQENFHTQKDRLFTVRKNKAVQHEMAEDLPDDCDLFSDTSSIMGSTGTRSSGRSFRSSKNRRKHERKLVSLKEGSRYEDVALIRSLHNIITCTYGLRQDVGEVNFVLQWLHKDEEVLKLQNSLDALLKQMSDSFNDIWISDLWKDSNKIDAGIKLDTNDLPDPTASLESHLKVPPVIYDVKWKVESLL